MKYRAEFELDRPYFEESFDQWLRHRSKYRRRQVQMSVLLVILGLLLITRGPAWLSATVFMIGVFELVEFIFYRHRWIGQRIEARLMNTHNRIELEVDDFGMYQRGPTSEGTLSWDSIKEVFPTEKGMFLAIGDGMSVYIPNSSVGDQRFRDFVVERAKGEA